MITIDIIQNAGDWPEIAKNLIRNALEESCKHIYVKEGSEVSVMLCNDRMIQDLNKTYRGKDKPTNVLSFPQDEPGLLGDIVLSYETIEKEAKEQQKAFGNHLIHLTIHGFLHLNGFDHEEDSDAKEMETLEIKILKKFGVKNPYESNDKLHQSMA